MKYWPILSLCVLSLYANPSSPSVIAGEASFADLGKILQINTSDETILHWKEFSVQNGETTQFIQPSEQSWVLNRVIDQNPTEILGTLQSNGQVFLINPFGMVFHEQSQIDTAGFLASTLDVLDENGFKNGKVEFMGGSQKALVHHGVIQAGNGNVILLGNQVENHGEIHAIECWIAAAQEVLFKPFGEDKIWIRPQGDTIKNDEAIGILNTGTISCAQAQLLAEGNPYGFAIKQEGEIDALGMVSHEGKVLLVAEEGTIGIFGSLSSQNEAGTGGEIQILGGNICLLDDCLIDASAPLGNGNIEIGNHSTSHLYVSGQSNIHADALIAGRGGNVLLWGEESNQFYGTITACGGKDKGDGGFVEVSSPGVLYPQGFVCASAMNGKTGTYLIDPTDVAVIASPGPPVESGYVNAGGAPPPPPPLTFTAGSAVIFETTINGILAGGTSLVIDTNSGFGSAGNITIGVPRTSADITYASAADLTFRANGNITIFESMVDNTLAAGGGDVTFEATAGTITMVAGATEASISSLSGAVNVTCANLVMNGSAADFSVIAGGSVNNINVLGDLILNGSPAGGGGSRINSFGPLNISVGRNFTSTMPISGAGNIIATSAALAPFPINLTVGGNIDVNGGLLFTSSFDINISAGGSMSMIGTTSNCLIFTPLALPFSTLNVTVAGDITMNSPAAGGHGIASSGDMTIRSAGSITIGANSGLSIFQAAPLIRADMLVIADRDILVSTQLPVGVFAGISNNTPGGEINFVVDNAFPAPFGMGPGSLVISANPALTSPITTSGGPIRFFTSRRAQNFIGRGFFDSLTSVSSSFMPGPIFVNSPQEQWGVYFFDSFFGGPGVTIFYKEGISILITAAQVGFVAGAELFRDLHPFDEWILWFMRFKTQYEDEKNNTDGFSTYEIVKETPFALPRREFPRDRVYLPKE